MTYSAQILADSVSPLGIRLVSFAVRFPRFILAEVNTHRVLSRNFESSRAVPVSRRLEAVRAHPFVPEAFGAARKGMQAGADLDGVELHNAQTAWMDAVSEAVSAAERLAALGVHKQLANRVLEPFSFVSGIITATEWENFFALRLHPDAQPEFQRLARMMRAAMDASEPRLVEFGEWHLPYGEAGDDWRVSAGRCARVSYLTHDGVRDPMADRALTARLQTSGHMSPLEHPATPVDDPGFIGNFRGWRQARKFVPGEAVFGGSRS